MFYVHLLSLIRMNKDSKVQIWKSIINWPVLKTWKSEIGGFKKIWNSRFHNRDKSFLKKFLSVGFPRVFSHSLTIVILLYYESLHNYSNRLLVYDYWDRLCRIENLVQSWKGAVNFLISWSYTFADHPGCLKNH